MIEVPVVDRLGAHSTGRPGHGGPPRFFALLVAPSGTMLAGTCERGIARRAAGAGDWSPVTAPIGGAVVNGFAVASDGALLAAAGTSGVIRSDDDGLTWERIGPEVDVAYAVLDRWQRMVVGTDQGLAVRSAGGPWQTVADGPRSTVYRLLEMSDGRLVAGTELEGVWIGDGDEWTPSGCADWPVFALAELRQGRLLAGTRGGGVMVSDDGGAVWRGSNAGLPDSMVHTLLVAPDGSVLAGTGRGVARSDDGGVHWEQVGGELAMHRIFSLAAESTTVYAGSYEGVWASTRHGRWTAVDTGLSAGQSFAVGCSPAGVSFAGIVRGACRSDDDGSTWEDRSPGIDADAVFHFCFTSTGAVLAGTDDGVRVLTDGSPTWQRGGLDGMRAYTLIEPEPGVVMAGTLGNGVHRRDSSGEWHQANVGLPFRMAYDLLASPGTGHLFVATGDVAAGEKTGGVFRSTDRGRSWAALPHDPISVYRIVETSTGVLFGGAQRTCILRSADGGETWEASHPAGLIDSKMYCLIVDAADRLFVGSGAQLLCSEDLGASWMIVGGGLDGVTVYALAATPAGTLIAATTSGMYRSTDNGLSFEPALWLAVTR